MLNTFHDEKNMFEIGVDECARAFLCPEPSPTNNQHQQTISSEMSPLLIESIKSDCVENVDIQK